MNPDNRPAEHSSQVVTLGETMALMISAGPGPLAHAGHLRLGIGGAESNTAIGLARLGVTTAWVGRVGADPLGELVQREIRAEGVHVTAIVDPSAPTGLMVKERRSALRTSVMYYRRDSAGSRLSPGDVPVAQIENASVLHLTGITPALSASASAAVDVAVDAARHGNTRISLDVNYRSALWSREAAAERLIDLAAKADLLFAGEDEAAILVGPADGPHEYANRLLELGAREAVVKCGPNGAVTGTSSGTIAAPAQEIPVIDTVGAGDAFVAGYLFATLQGTDVPTRLRTANATGAYACMVAGDWEGAARPTDLEALLRPGHDPVAR